MPSNLGNEVNPYDAPLSGDRAVDEGVPEPLPRLGRAVGLWSLVCAASAAPSFLVGMAISRHVLQIPVMLAGVLCFIIAYVATERTAQVRRLMQSVVLRRSLKTAFAIRVIISIIFPIAMMNDMLCGSFSVAVVSNLTGGQRQQLSSALQIFLTTILQGLVLNLEIYILATCFAGCAYAWLAIRQ